MEMGDYMELTFLILFMIGSWLLPYIIEYNKSKKEIEEKKKSYLRGIELITKLRSGQELTQEEFDELLEVYHLVYEAEKNVTIEDDLKWR